MNTSFYVTNRCKRLTLKAVALVLFALKQKEKIWIQFDAKGFSAVVCATKTTSVNGPFLTINVI